MVNRAILIQPKFVSIDKVEKVRSMYDPLYGKTKPHITLVFPFLSSFSKEEIQHHVQNIAVKFTKFSLKMKEISLIDSDYIFLNVYEGIVKITELYELLYTGALDSFKDKGKQYKPHMTIGRVKNNKDRNKIIKNIKNLDIRIDTIVEEIVIEKIDKCDFGEIESRIRLK